MTWIYFGLSFAHAFPTHAKRLFVSSSILVMISSLVYTGKKEFHQSTQFNYSSCSLRSFPLGFSSFLGLGINYLSFVCLKVHTLDHPFPSTLTEKILR